MQARSADFDKKVRTLLDSVVREKLRPIQKQTYECSVQCCSNQSASNEAVDECVGRCAQPFQAAQQMVMQEVQRFQTRLQRCTQQCADSVQDKVPSTGVTPELEQKLMGELEKCGGACLDEHEKMLPGLASRLKERVSNK